MKYITIPSTDLQISKLGLGTVNAGISWDYNRMCNIIGNYLELGGNFLDTARVYSDWIPGDTGRSEKLLGRWIQNNKEKRDKIYISTKGGHHNVENPNVKRVCREEVEKDLDLSLKTLHVDYIDLYFYHRDDQDIPVKDLIECMETFKRKGKIKYYGCSNWSTKRIAEAERYANSNGYTGFVLNQAHFNIGALYQKPLEDQSMVQMDIAMREYHKKNKFILAMPYSSVANGFFHKLLNGQISDIEKSYFYTEKNIRIGKALFEALKNGKASLTQLLLGFFEIQDFQCIPLYSPQNPLQIIEACKTFDMSFEKKEYDFVYQL